MVSSTALLVTFVGWLGLFGHVGGISQDYWEVDLPKGSSALPLRFHFKATNLGFKFDIDLGDITLLEAKARFIMHFAYAELQTDLVVFQWKYDSTTADAPVYIAHHDGEGVRWDRMGAVDKVKDYHIAHFNVDGSGLLTLVGKPPMTEKFMLKRPTAGIPTSTENTEFIINCTITYRDMPEPVKLKVKRSMLYVPPPPPTTTTTTIPPPTTTSTEANTEEDESEDATTEKEEKTASASTSITGIIVVVAIIVILIAIITIGAVVLCQFLKAHRNALKNNAAPAQRQETQEPEATPNTKQKRPSATPATTPVTDRPQSLPTR
uniref:DOMON domain-containing protein n=1 Tax=Panagrellus redivivus TaxID=6233 RepID=A0A7E4VFW1_PANRE